MERSGVVRLVVVGWFAVAGVVRADEPAPAAVPSKASATEPSASSVAPAAASGRSATGFLSSVPVIKPAVKPAKAAAGGIAGTVAVGSATPADYPDLATYPMQGAIRAAITKVQGKVLKVELEPADGFLVWEIELVKSDKTIMAVKVDAGSGAVLKVERDEPGSDEE